MEPPLTPSRIPAGRACYALGILLFVPCSLFPQSPSTLHVPRNFPSIQHAIDRARPGDTVLVDDGLYFENLRIQKNIVVASKFILDGDEAHVWRTIIDGSKPRDSLFASTVFISGPTDTTCMLVGFTIRGGSGSYVNVPGDLWTPHWIGGGGVMVLHAGARVAHNLVTQNVVSARNPAEYTFGAGIASSGTTSGRTIPPAIIVEHNIVVGNTSSGEVSEGGGIEVIQPGVIRHNIVMYNRTYSRTRSYGGGIYVGLQAEYDILVDGNYVKQNIATIGGGALVTCAFVRRGRAIFTNNIIAENEAFEVGGAVNVAEQSYAIFINNTIVANKALSTGGGLNVTSGSHAILVNNILSGNERDQVSDWGMTQAMHNLIEGGLPGRGNLSDDPQFLHADSLYRLSPESPCIDNGLDSVWLADRLFPLPLFDRTGHPRIHSAGGRPDLGATETPWDNAGPRERGSGLDGYLKLTIILRQTSPAVRRETTGEIVRAGDMATTLVFDDPTRTRYESAERSGSIVLEPGDNLLDVEVIGRGRDSAVGLNAFLWLEGFDRHVSILEKNNRSLYRYFFGLQPGEYRLMVQPQDETSIIGHTNLVSILFTVPPYWYESWWAFLMYAALLLASALGFVQLRVRRIRLLQDLSLKRLETEKLAQVDRMKSRFFANLSHEFRTPLSLILGPADQLSGNESDSLRREQLSTIRRNAERLLRMVNMLLQFARLEAGTLKLRVSMQPVPPLINRILSSFSTAATKKGISLTSDIDPPAFSGFLDTEKVEHILENVLSNAIKYSSPGASVRIVCRRVGTDLRVEVIDTGKGIPAEHLPHLFERFYRVDHSHHVEGTGIGLSLTKELVEMHGGTIRLESVEGVGTTVTIVLPMSGHPPDAIVERDVAGEKRPRPHHAESVSPAVIREDGERPVVLVVEDNDDARAYACSRMNGEYFTLEARNGEEALTIARERIPDVVVSDVMMPEMSGYELCVALKQDERTSHIPVVLLTALADRTDRIEGLQTGADDYLVKPFDAEELLVRVRNLIANRRRLHDRFQKKAQLKPGEIQVSSLDDKFLEKVLGVVERHMGEETFTVEQFAFESHLSRAQLHRKIKALTGLAPTDLIRHLRLLRAKELLEKRAGGVSEIAFQVGFGSPSYFSQAFKDQFGLSPSEIKGK